MEVWTIQNENVWNKLSNDGIYRVADDDTYPYMDGLGEVPDKFLLICYKWMAHQLYRKTGEAAPIGTRFPIWGWTRQWNGKGAKPDMRSWTTQEPERVVRLRLEIDDSRLLVSDFDMWHIPLNMGYLSFTRDGDDRFDHWCESVGIDCFRQDIWDFSKQSHALSQARREIFKSWEGIFPPFPEAYDEDWVGNLDDDALQAVFWEIRKDDVVSCEHFTTRKAWTP